MKGLTYLSWPVLDSRHIARITPLRENSLGDVV
jgi:hypothetical protein